MRRTIRIVGCPGSGKSTLARELARRLRVEHIELDAHFHLAGWTPNPNFREEVRARMQECPDGWVMDGNYRATLEEVGIDEADTIVWLDLPRRAVMRQLVVRTLDRGIRRLELWNGNRERIANVFHPDRDKNILLWAWTQYPDYRRTYERDFQTTWRDKATVRLRDREAVAAYVDSVSRRS